MAREDEEPERAVYWLAQAYDTSKGRATRFQWGTSYLMGMMDLLPDEAERIQTESIRVLREMLAFDDAFAGRNALRIGWLAGGFVEWNAEEAHAAKIASVRTELLPTCEGLSDEILEEAGDEPESLQSRCNRLLHHTRAKLTDRVRGQTVRSQRSTGKGSCCGQGRGSSSIFCSRTSIAFVSWASCPRATSSECRSTTMSGCTPSFSTIQRPSGS